MGYEVAIIEDGSTWTGSKERLAREVERANISGTGLIVSHKRRSTACTEISGDRSMRSARMIGELQICAQYF